MQKQFSIPLVFLSIGGCIGLLLRWNFISPQAWINYPYWLHGHSHIMFLGWVINLIMLSYIFLYKLWSHRRYRLLFYFIQMLVVGMLISFPLQGYGVVTIILSVIHTFSIWLFVYFLFKDLKLYSPAVSVWCTKATFVLFIISSLAPFALAPIMANGLGHSKWYFFIVYYYLHFQYNGVFIIGILSLCFQLFEQRRIVFNVSQARWSMTLLVVSLFPTYLLSTLWAKPGIVYSIIGGVGSVIQLVALYFFISSIRGVTIFLNRWSRILMTISLICFGIKSVLQLLSSHPAIAKLAYDVRPFVIAYLHLVVIGVVTLFLFAWLIEQGLLEIKSFLPVVTLVIAFVGSELCMVAGGISQFDSLHFTIIKLQFFFSVLMLLVIIHITQLSIFKSVLAKLPPYSVHKGI